MYAPQNSSRLSTANNVVVATTSTAVASTAFGGQTYQIRIASPAAAFYRVGDATPTAVATDAYLPPNVIEYVKVSPGQKISVFSATLQTVSVVEISG
ncbi:hypothetical protein AB8A05_04190 [Tardiphaga sp. 538_B7_N1_4]|uniref:hypothetical protein n=1 Tax=Tardiphaga sp. 538_B7_N1_4 TaxID=3240778 RepID=UPI003F256633